MIFKITYLTTTEAHIRIDIPEDEDIDAIIEKTKYEITCLTNLQVTLGRDVSFEWSVPEKNIDALVAVMLLIGHELGNQCHSMAMFNCLTGAFEAIQNKI